MWSLNLKKKHFNNQYMCYLGCAVISLLKYDMLMEDYYMNYK